MDTNILGELYNSTKQAACRRLDQEIEVIQYRDRDRDKYKYKNRNWMVEREGWANLALQIARRRHAQLGQLAEVEKPHNCINKYRYTNTYTIAQVYKYTPILQSNAETQKFKILNCPPSTCTTPTAG